jgi:hypothetical protein
MLKEIAKISLTGCQINALSRLGFLIIPKSIFATSVNNNTGEAILLINYFILK